MAAFFLKCVNDAFNSHNYATLSRLKGITFVCDHFITKSKINLKIKKMLLKKMSSIAAMLLVVFMMGCKKEPNPGIAPEVNSTIPVNKAVSVATNNKISATFSAAMDPSTITVVSFTLLNGSTAVSGVAGYTDKTATFTPSASLAPNTLYSATITTVAQNTTGNALTKDYNWSFTTGDNPDITAPTVTSDPANNSADVAINKLLVITFSKPMEQATINSSTFSLKQGSTSVSGTITLSTTTATFTPTGNFAYNTKYDGTVTTGAKDLSGNALAANYTFSFTTLNAPDIIMPTVISVTPLDNAVIVPRNTVVAITFSEAMAPLTISASTFNLMQGTTSVPGTVSYSGTIATFTPLALLAPNTIYTASITTDAKDLAGNSLASAKTWSFTTTGSSSTLALVDLGTAANYVILAKTAINNNPTSSITGDLGLSPAATSYITGFALTNATGYATSSQVTGKVFAADMVTPTSDNLTTAVENMLTAYTDAAGRPTPDFLELATGSIGGKTLTPGLYKWTSTVNMASDVVISGGANDVWIFQISGDLSLSNSVKVTLSGGAQAKNIFWQVAGNVTVGTTAHLEGIILSMTGITFQTGASLNGRALAQTAIVLDGNSITQP